MTTTTTTTTETSAPVAVISAKKRQSLLMEREAKSFASQQSNYPRRSKAMTPTYEEIQSTTFTEYVQHALFDEEDSDDEANGNENKRTNRAPATEEKIRNRKISFTDGVVKISLPNGWWDEAGIGKDRTARGPAVSFSFVCLILFALFLSHIFTFTKHTVARRDAVG
jgi:hypothetical protein